MATFEAIPDPSVPDLDELLSHRMFQGGSRSSFLPKDIEKEVNEIIKRKKIAPLSRTKVKSMADSFRSLLNEDNPGNLTSKIDPLAVQGGIKTEAGTPIDGNVKNENGIKAENDASYKSAKLSSGMEYLEDVKPSLDQLGHLDLASKDFDLGLVTEELVTKTNALDENFKLKYQRWLKEENVRDIQNGSTDLREGLAALKGVIGGYKSHLNDIESIRKATQEISKHL